MEPKMKENKLKWYIADKEYINYLKKNIIITYYKGCDNMQALNSRSIVVNISSELKNILEGDNGIPDISNL